MNLETPRLALDIIKREYSEQTGKLVLSDCGLQNFPPEIFDMTWLTELTITNGQETNQRKSKMAPTPNFLSSIPEEIGRLENLEMLWLGGLSTDRWPIQDISPVMYLNNLKSLNLSSNSLTNLPSLTSLNKLKILTLNNNNIENIYGIFTCPNLDLLEVENNRLAYLNFNNIAKSKVKTLSLRNNKIYIIEGINNLFQLETLDLTANEIESIYFLEKSTTLQSIFLSENKIIDIRPLAKIKSLENIILSNNAIEDIEPLGIFKSINSIHIDENKVKSLLPLTFLKSLKHLYADKNQITSAEPIHYINGLEQISIQDNPIKDCPPDVYQTNDVQQIKAYFESQSRDKNFIAPRITENTPPAPTQAENETVSPLVDDIKLIFVGNSGAGKTQLSKYFESGKLDKTRESTHGIRLKRWLPNPKTSEAFQPLKNEIAANTWDFGGQEYYHGTFRLFLSNFAVYILLWEIDTNDNEVLLTQTSETASEEIQHFPYEYWLDNIRHYAPTSPILIVQNKIDKDGIQRIDTQLLLEYNVETDFQISLFGVADQRSKNYEWRFHLFCDALANAFKKVRHQELLQSQKSPAWLAVRDAIVDIAHAKKPNAKNPFAPFMQAGQFIQLDDFRKACLNIEKDLTETELYTLPRWLHNSGVVIYFGKNPRLQNRVYLNPTWVTEKIYTVLDKTVRDKQGSFATSDIKARKNFPRDTILALMKEMELIFERFDQPDHFVAPQYLPEHHPIEDLYAIAERGLQQDAFFVRLPLYFFRKVLQRLIFFYGQSPSVNARYYWKKGILFEKQSTRIIVKGMLDPQHSNCGILLVGAEPTGNYTAIQKEVFHFITKILEDEDLGSFLRTDTTANTPADQIYHRSTSWTARYEPHDIPRWLHKMEVSVNGQDYVNYYKLCQANKEEDLFIHNAQNKKLRIHDFALLVDTPPKRPLKIFFSYSHKDTAVMEALSVHLAPLKRLEKIEVWSDRAIQAGDEWDTSIEENLRNSDIVLFLISADFVASSYIWDKEIPLALQYQNDTIAAVKKVIPIYLRPFDYSDLAFTYKEMIPKDPSDPHRPLKAISQWENKDAAYMEIAKALRTVIDSIN